MPSPSRCSRLVFVGYSLSAPSAAGFFYRALTGWDLCRRLSARLFLRISTSNSKRNPHATPDSAEIAPHPHHPSCRTNERPARRRTAPGTGGAKGVVFVLDGSGRLRLMADDLASVVAEAGLPLDVRE